VCSSDLQNPKTPPASLLVNTLVKVMFKFV